MQGSGYGSFPGQTYNGGGGGNGYGGGRGGGHHGGGDYGYGGGPHGGGGGHPPMGGGPGGGGGGDYSAQWADYYRSLGMTREAELIEQQQQQGGNSNPGILSWPVPYLLSQACCEDPNINCLSPLAPPGTGPPAAPTPAAAAPQPGFFTL